MHLVWETVYLRRLFVLPTPTLNNRTTAFFHLSSKCPHYLSLHNTSPKHFSKYNSSFIIKYSLEHWQFLQAMHQKYRPEKEIILCILNESQYSWNQSRQGTASKAQTVGQTDSPPQQCSRQPNHCFPPPFSRASSMHFWLHKAISKQRQKQDLWL